MVATELTTLTLVAAANWSMPWKRSLRDPYRKSNLSSTQFTKSHVSWKSSFNYDETWTSYRHCASQSCGFRCEILQIHVCFLPLELCLWDWHTWAFPQLTGKSLGLGSELSSLSYIFSVMMTATAIAMRRLMHMMNLKARYKIFFMFQCINHTHLIARVPNTRLETLG